MRARHSGEHLNFSTKGIMPIHRLSTHTLNAQQRHKASRGTHEQSQHVASLCAKCYLVPGLTSRIKLPSDPPQQQHNMSSPGKTRTHIIDTGIYTTPRPQLPSFPTGTGAVTVWLKVIAYGTRHGRRRSTRMCSYKGHKPERLLEPCSGRGLVGGRSLTELAVHQRVEV